MLSVFTIGLFEYHGHPHSVDPVDIQLIPVEQFQNFLIVTARVAGFIGAIPVISGAQTPARIKTALVFAISLVLFPTMGKLLPAVSFSPIPFLLLVINEMLLGMVIGLIARLIFTSVEFGATVIGYQMGFAAANIFDPQGERQVALLSQFQNVFAILIFLSQRSPYFSRSCGSLL